MHGGDHARFGGRGRDDTDLPPGQYRTDDFSLVLLGRRHRLAPWLSALRRHPSNPTRENPKCTLASSSTAWCFWSAGTCCDHAH